MKDGENESYHEWLKRTSAPPPMPPEKFRHRQAAKGIGEMVINGAAAIFIALVMIVAGARCQQVQSAPKPEPLAGVAAPLPAPYESESFMVRCLVLNGSNAYYFCSPTCKRAPDPDLCKRFGKAYDDRFGDPKWTKRQEELDAEWERKHPEYSDHL